MYRSSKARQGDLAGLAKRNINWLRWGVSPLKRMVARAGFVVKRTGAGWRAATYSILTDRAIGLIALALVIVASLPWSYAMIADSKGRLALVFVDFAALAGGLGFLLLGHLPWTWLKSWWPTRHVHACSLIANKVIFNLRSGPKIAVLSLRSMCWPS